VISPIEARARSAAGLGEGRGARELERWQLERLGETIARARRGSGFYAGRLGGLGPSAPGSLEGLDQVPFTNPSDLARFPLGFLCVSQGEVERVVTLRSSGTTGLGKRLFFTKGDLDRTVDFFALGMGPIMGEGRRALILLPGETEGGVSRLLSEALGRSGVEAVAGGAVADVGSALEAARGADCIVGAPADLVRLCRSGGSLRPRSVLLSADYVPQSAVRAIEAAWGCEVFTHYGMTETGYGLAVQCAARETHHIRHDEFLVEVVDPASGRRLAAGELGEIVISSLRAEAMPLIRYRTGDLGRLIGGACPCGGTLPRLGRVEGRMASRIALRGGGSIGIHELDELLFEQPSVRGFEATLRRGCEGESLILEVDSGGELDRGSLAERLPPGLGLELRYGEAGSLSRGAKRRIAIDEGR
jgi:phenylacetate-coenzyme A ligase PaaK-like adenylate-forming protein